MLKPPGAGRQAGVAGLLPPGAGRQAGGEHRNGPEYNGNRFNPAGRGDVLGSRRTRGGCRAGERDRRRGGKWMEIETERDRERGLGTPVCVRVVQMESKSLGGQGSASVASLWSLAVRLGGGGWRLGEGVRGRERGGGGWGWHQELRED